ncbi:Unannotated [Lentimonas sp. CC19]|nr:Unannotated [Lentimonas sp. CC4]CAA6685018.1 Unannotated [Lentimonas sp. CC6]CAA6691692.1 Unannotated [Lentimonas sp. CC19]CAA6696022.1 Unannotated [Lentimonas sp. CC10]CAA7070046.1 Unannotated [Lentimonas sp. CC11]CAA7169792.1 Unannotated [Lentimonas sp. CC21]CAA7179910.1 Unannotated [Lentimonas sp. CC8]
MLCIFSVAEDRLCALIIAYVRQAFGLIIYKPIFGHNSKYILQ